LKSDINQLHTIAVSHKINKKLSVKFEFFLYYFSIVLIKYIFKYSIEFKADSAFLAVRSK